MNVLAIDVPGKMDIPTVANSGTTVVVTYTAPTTHSSAITDYDVQFLKSDSTTDTLACVESSATSLTCTVNTDDVRTLTSRAVDTLIRVKVRAENAKGWGAYSEFNSAGALIQSKPSVMVAPTVNTASVSKTSIPLSWSAPTGVSAGGTGVTISGYYLQVSNDGTTWTDVSTNLATTSYTYAVSDDTKDYYFRIAATNIYGTQATFSPATALTKAS